MINVTRVRVFYGHEGVIRPTGLIVAEAPADEAGAEARPDKSWLVPAIDEWAAARGVEFPDGALKADKLEVINALDEIPAVIEAPIDEASAEAEADAEGE